MDKRETQQIIADWMANVRESTGLSLNKIAKTSGVSVSTLSRWSNPGEDYDFHASMPKIMAVAIATKCSPPAMMNLQSIDATVFAEPDATELEKPPLEAGLQELTPNQTAWRITGRAVELAGYIPQDIVVVDAEITPQAGDIVCAEHYDRQRGSERPVFRLYDPPYLVTTTADPSSRAKPITIESVEIKGVITYSIRRRAAS